MGPTVMLQVLMLGLLPKKCAVAAGQQNFTLTKVETRGK